MKKMWFRCRWVAAFGLAASLVLVTFGGLAGRLPLYPVTHPRAGLFLHNPPALRSLLLGHYGWWNLWLAAGPVALQIPDELDSVANAAHVRAPAVVVSGQKDDYVPPVYHRKVIAALAGPTQI